MVHWWCSKQAQCAGCAGAHRRPSSKVHVAEAVGNGGGGGLWTCEKRCVFEVYMCERSHRQGRIKAF